MNQPIKMDKKDMLLLQFCMTIKKLYRTDAQLPVLQIFTAIILEL